MRISRQLLTKYLVIASAPVVVTAVGISAIAVQSPDTIYSVKAVNFTTRARTPNLIVVHTGGFDFNAAVASVASNAAFKDFYQLAHVYGAGASAALSKALGAGGAPAYDPATLYERDPDTRNWVDAVANGEFGAALARHFQVNAGQFSQQVLFGFDDVVAPGGKAYRGGDAPIARRLFGRSVELVNWTGARNLITGAVGVTETAFDNLQLRAFSKIADVAPINASTSNPLGTQVFLQADFTRPPYQVAANGNYAYDVSLPVALATQAAELAALMNNLKTLVDPTGRSVYDNSVIVLWSSADSTREAMVAGDLVHPVSALVKLPDQVLPQLTTINDALVSLGQLNALITSFFMTRPRDLPALLASPAYALDRALTFYTGNSAVPVARGQLVANAMRLVNAAVVAPLASNQKVGL